GHPCRRSRGGRGRCSGSRGRRERRAGDATCTIAAGIRGGRGLRGWCCCCRRWKPRGCLCRLLISLCALFSPLFVLIQN
ncbi:hypothetical protein LINPERHAP2_LOCUS40739, partial [Linum perenne]